MTVPLLELRDFDSAPGALLHMVLHCMLVQIIKLVEERIKNFLSPQ